MRKLFFGKKDINEYGDFPQQMPSGSAEDTAQYSVENSAGDCSVTVNRNGRYIHCLTIIGQVEGHYVLPPDTKATRYEEMIPRIVAVEENSDVDGLLMILNTAGGDIEAGLAIAELVAGMKKPTASLVLGGSHSIGIPLAVSAKRSFIVPTASMTVHPVRMNGVILGVPQTLLYLNKMEERVIGFVTRNSDISASRFKELMMNKDELISDFGTVLGGIEAVNEGLIDRIGGISDALDAIESMCISGVRKKFGGN